MKTELVAGVPLGLRDAEVLAALSKVEDHIGGQECRIGIRNEAGVIYRVVKAWGLQEWIACDNKLYDLGGKNELAESMVSKHGFDSIFSFPK